MLTTLEFSVDQENALTEICIWRARAGGGDYLTLGGFAGTGKTTVVGHLAELWPGVAFVALCGKATHILRSKGVNAQTVHSLIYVPFENAAGNIRYRRRDSLNGVRVIVCDEASMVDHVLMQDLLSFDLPVLFVGDHGQLEPIGTNPGLMVNPQVRLEKIHRQAMDNPILRLATAFREGRAVPKWDDPNGRLRVLSRSAFERQISPDLQILCGYNKTRRAINARVREMLGFRDLVCPGDRLVVLKNNKAWGIFNGQQVTVLGIWRYAHHVIELEVETDDGRSFTVPCLKAQFGNDTLTDCKVTQVALMDYGYCLTAHKAQGSEWPEVLVLEEIASAWCPKRWRYTVATRAKERLVYCG